MSQPLSSADVRDNVQKGRCEFWSRIHGRKITLGGWSFDDGVAAYGHLWDAAGEDWERIELVDISCLDALSDGDA
jgi:hypothetical protein